MEIIQKNACVIHFFILALNDTTNERIAGAVSLTFKKMAALFNKKII